MKTRIAIVIAVLAACLAACATRYDPNHRAPDLPGRWHKAGCSASPEAPKLPKGSYPSTPSPMQKDGMCE